MWTARGLEKRTLSFAFTELLLHSISDLILDAFIGRGLAYPSIPVQQIPKVSLDKPTKSLKPFAKNLSHELRTPMQGIVGMLDLMHGTVQDACEEQMSSSLQGVLNSVKKDIEVVQGRTDMMTPEDC
jgi:signal transduction histidine kinase